MKEAYGFVFLLLFFQVAGQDNNRRWYSSLPPCPCTYKDALSRGKTNSPYPKGTWKDYGNATQKYHYGASKEVRWTPDEYNKPGQQCTYDTKGNLITDGIAAGSPDKVSPGKISLDIYDHLDIDVTEFNKQSCELYLKGTAPPNKGESSCNTKDNSVNSITHLIPFVYQLTCPDIIRILQDLRDVPNANPTVKEFMIKGKVDDRDKAKFLLLYFRGYSTKVKSKNRIGSLNFSNSVIKYLEEYLMKELDQDDNASLSEGAKLLFKGVKTKLSTTEKNFIYTKLGFHLSKDKKYFTDGESEEDAFSAEVLPTDMNKDGLEEIFVSYGNNYTSGMTGSEIVLFINTNGSYQENLGFPGLIPDALSSSNQGYLDLLIGGPGFEFPIWRWNGNKYSLYRRINDKDVRTIKTTNIEAISKAYRNTFK